MDWIDIPVLKAMEYFSGVMAWFLKFGSINASLIGLLGIIWSAFKILNARVGAKQAFFDIFYKWLLFVIMINMYVPFAQGIGWLGNKIGTVAGNGKQTIVNALNDIKLAITTDLETQQYAANDLNGDLLRGTKIKQLDLDLDFSNYNSFNDYVEAIETATINSGLPEGDKQNIQKKLEAARNDAAYFSAHDRATLNALKSVLVEKKMDGTDGNLLVNSYIDLDIFLKDKDGNDTSYFSPSALCRLVMLTAQIMRAKLEQEWALADADWESENLGTGFWSGGEVADYVKSIGYDFSMTIKRIPASLLCFLSQLLLLFTSIFCVINYVMVVFEYIIVIGIGSFFLPFILFDGTKDMAKKLVPVFTGFFIKFIVIDIIMFFVYWLYIDQCVNTIGDSGGINITTFATVAFNAVVALVLTRQAPKIADTLLTGRPSLDFGELRQTMHDIRATTRTIRSGVQNTGRAAAWAGRNGINGTINTIGGINKALHAGQEASALYKARDPAEGQPTKLGSAGRFMAGMGASFLGDAGEAIKGGVENFLHGGGSHGRGAGSGSGGGSGTAFMRSGQRPGEEKEDNNSINNRSNPKFQGASMYDKDTRSSRNMTMKEFIGEKGSQGKNIGKNVDDFFNGMHKKKKTSDQSTEAENAAKKEQRTTEDIASIGGSRQSEGSQGSGHEHNQSMPKYTPPPEEPETPPPEPDKGSGE